MNKYKYYFLTSNKTWNKSRFISFISTYRGVKTFKQILNPPDLTESFSSGLHQTPKIPAKYHSCYHGHLIPNHCGEPSTKSQNILSYRQRNPEERRRWTGKIGPSPSSKRAKIPVNPERTPPPSWPTKTHLKYAQKKWSEV